MGRDDLVARLSAVDVSTAGEIFRSFLRGSVRELVMTVMAEEVSHLCGPAYARHGSRSCRRAGSSGSTVLYEGRAERVRRPRVRRVTSEGGSEEVVLSTYAAARDPAQLREAMLAAFATGTSSRDQRRLREAPGTSRSAVSRLWRTVGSRMLEEFRSRDIGADEHLVLMLDGIALGGDHHAVVALGVRLDGRKRLLDFEIGSSESVEVCDRLLSRLRERGFRGGDGRLLGILDGSIALKRGLLRHYPDAVVQRCLVHKERNLRSYLSKRRWGEVGRLFSRLRKAQGEAAARDVVKELRRFLESTNAAALKSLEESGDELIALHCLNVPATLNTSLLSTNAIENAFRNVRSKLERVTRWRPETDQASRWLAYGLLEAERGFRRIQHYDALPALAAALRREAPGADESSRTPPPEDARVLEPGGAPSARPARSRRPRRLTTENVCV